MYKGNLFRYVKFILGTINAFLFLNDWERFLVVIPGGIVKSGKCSVVVD